MRTQFWYVWWLVSGGWVHCGRCSSLEGEGLKHRRRGSPRPYGKDDGACLACVCMDVCLDMGSGHKVKAFERQQASGGSGPDQGRLVCFDCREEGARPIALPLCLACLVTIITTSKYALLCDSVCPTITPLSVVLVAYV